MPKQTFHINRFEGGMNLDSAPEDIPDNSFLDAMGISVSKVGRVVMPGNPRAELSDLDVNSYNTKGYGLFAFSSDYFTDNSEPEVATKYLALANGSAIKIWNGAAWNADSTGFDMGASDTANPTEPSFYAPNGDLRVCDGKFTNINNWNNNVKWFGYTPNKTIGTGTGDATIGGWSVADASIEGGYPKDSSGIATNAMMMDNTSSAADDIYAYTSAASGNDWGFHFEYVPASDSSSAFAGSTWQPSVNTEYKFYTSYVYDDIQEGNPTPLKMYPTLAAYTADDTSPSSTSNLKFMDRGTSNCVTSITATAVSSTTLTVTATNGFTAGDTVIIEGTSTYDGEYTVLSGGLSGSAFTVTVDSGTANNDEDGYVSKVGTNLAIYFSPNFKFNGGNSQDFNFGASAVGDASGGNQRITGSRVYYSSSDDGHANLWIMFDANWEKGVKAFGVGKDEPTVTDYIPWNNVDDDQDDVSVDLGDYNLWRHPPRYETYESLNGYSHNSKLDAKWKTAVIANGRAYIGNVKRRQKSTFDVNDTALTSGKQDWNGHDTNSSTHATNVKKDPTFSDRILKSPVDRFDTFPEEMAIELFGGDDGDSIVKLEAFADRLFVFKKNTLHILNIAKDVEILESSHKSMGLDGGYQCQSCLTSQGIAWINSNGAYLYNGQSIQSISDNKIEAYWKGTISAGGAGTWTAWFQADDIPSIGYDYSSSKLIMQRTTSDAGAGTDQDILLYDTRLNAWTRLNDALSDENRSNMVNYDGNLIYHEDNASTDKMYYYSDAPHEPGGEDLTVGDALSVYTKPYDFGSPLQRKKIYKVYVTYRSNATTNVQVKYYTNGNKDTLYTFTTGATNKFNSDDDGIDADIMLDNTSGIWETAALKPNDSNEANNIKSFGLRFYNKASSNPASTFEINDITIVYRTKSVK